MLFRSRPAAVDGGERVGGGERGASLVGGGEKGGSHRRREGPEWSPEML
jgi:hypothetical protein